MVDMLHQDHNGVGKHLCKELVNRLTPSQLAQVNGRLKEMLPLHEAFYPFDGLEAKKATAEENRGLMKFLAVAVYGVVDDNITELIAGKAHDVISRSVT